MYITIVIESMIALFEKGNINRKWHAERRCFPQEASMREQTTAVRLRYEALSISWYRWLESLRVFYYLHSDGEFHGEFQELGITACGDW